ncbi:MAG: 3-dehydroquinate synthase [Candidatus Rokubacteria bacterium]|nr:3-dehydroquinate synthase [Candidatus Rokubacteria bacterium]
MIDIPVHLGVRSYRILVGPGALGTVGAELKTAGVGRKALVVSDPGVLARYGERVIESLEGAGFEVSRFAVPEGEAAKTLEVARRGWDVLLAAGLDRSSTVVAVGGGAVGDLAGFVAATYMRGVNFVTIPTTLLSQVDASSGGKTAVNHPAAKNLIGAFHQPRLVLVDPEVLLTLSERDYRSGLAEVVKHGIVLDAAYFADLESHRGLLLARDLATLTRVVAGSCRLKAGVVERDEQEAELRAVLNYGHTVGHAIEAVTGYGRFTHGEAVAIGIAAAARLAERLGVADTATRERQLRLLEALGLPVGGARVAPAAVLEAIGRDKKARDGRVPFVLAPAIGTFRLVFDVPAALVREVVGELA